MSNFVERETPEFPEKTYTFSPGREGKQHSHHIWHCSGWSRSSHKEGGGTSLRASFWSKNMGEARPGPPGPLPWIRYCIEFVVGSCLVPIRLCLERKRITEREKRDRRSAKGDGRRKTKWKDDWQILTQKVVRRLEKFCYLSQRFFSITLCVLLDRVSVVVRDFKIQRVTTRDQHQFSPDNISRS